MRSYLDRRSLAPAVLCALSPHAGSPQAFGQLGPAPAAPAAANQTHMELEPKLRQNIERAYYPSGHTIYLNVDALKQLTTDLAAFYVRRRWAPTNGHTE